MSSPPSKKDEKDGGPPHAYKIVSLFSGCGGMDLGFERTGHFTVVWANEVNKNARSTYEHNFPNTTFDGRDIREINASEIPDCDGVVGGPPCQPFSCAGRMRGVADPRGRLFLEFVRVVAAKRPSFIVLENVPLLASKRYTKTLERIVSSFRKLGYNMHVKLLNADDHGVAQSRKRLFVVGIRIERGMREYRHPVASVSAPTSLRSSIGDLGDSAIVARRYKTAHPKINAHEYVSIDVVGLSSYFMETQRVRSWDEVSYTIPASIASTPFHPSSPKLMKSANIPVCISRAERIPQYRMVEGHAYRKFTARECARIQGFPDDFHFKYKTLTTAHRMIGNAVPPPLAAAVAKSILAAIE